MSRSVLVLLFSLVFITNGFSQQDSVATESVVIKKKKILSDLIESRYKDYPAQHLLSSTACDYWVVC